MLVDRGIYRTICLRSRCNITKQRYACYQTDVSGVRDLDAFNVANESGGEDMTAHASDDEHMEVGSQENVFESLLEQVSDDIVQKELSSKEILLSQEQQEYARNLAKAPICRAVAGSGKTTVGGGAMLAALRIHRQRFPSHRSKFVWITKPRTQRDDARIALRGLVRNPLRVSSIGRLAGVGPTEEEDSQFDELVE